MRAQIPRGYVAGRAGRAIKIDGRLDDPDWKAAPWTAPFIDIEGARRPKPRFQTRAKMLWDDAYFYIAAWLEEPHVWGTLTQHDAVIFQDNDFEVFIDPDADNHEYYELEINALNTTWDLLLRKPYKDGGPAENAWEIPGLKSAVYIEGTLNQPADLDRGWSLEIAIPWAVLARYAHRPSPPQPDDQWRVNFSRVEWQVDLDGAWNKKAPNTKEDNWVWSPPGIIDMHRPERWGFVQFSGQPAGKTEAFRPDPTLPARDALMEIYHRQRVFQAKQRRWAGALQELGYEPPASAMLARPITLQLTAAGWQATALVKLNSQTQTWHVRQDSKIWRGETAPRITRP